MSVGIGTEVAKGATDYIYGIGTDWNLYQINVDPVGNSVSTIPKLNLSKFISGWGTAGRYNEYINGLGIDQSTGDIYFNYSYNNSNSGSTSGTATVVPYIYQNSGGTYKFPYALGAAINSPTLSFTSVSAGWVPRATYYNGNYYAGIQNSDTLVVLPISGTTTKSYGTISTYTDWDHSTPSVFQGGDFVIGSNNTIYGTAIISGSNTFYRQTLANATSSTGAAWTSFSVESSIPSGSQGSIQVAGLGQSANLYVVSSTGGTVYKVNGYDNVTAPTFSQVGTTGIMPVTMTDLSLIVSTPLPVPEASTMMGAAGVSAGVVLEFLRRRRRKSSFVVA